MTRKLREPGHDVLAVVTNYNRPDNVMKICRELRGQPCDVVVVDNAATPEKSVCSSVLTHVRDIFRMNENYGPSCRFAAAAMLAHRYEYTWLLDDDFMPASWAVDTLKRLAEKLPLQWTTLGQVGRRFGVDREGKPYYRKKNIGRNIGEMVPVDMTCRTHFFESSRAIAALDQMGLMAAAGKLPLTWEDDMMLCLSGTGCSYLVPSDQPIMMGNLPKGDDASGARPCHSANRTECARLSYELGWRSTWRSKLPGVKA